jgi:serine phosphatase RsbU (regulator of sigma subunit)/PAS domain-containing protein
MAGISEQGLEALAVAGRRAAAESGLDEALEALGQAAADVTGADAVAIRVADEDGLLSVRRVISRSEALAAELAGSSFSVAELPEGEASLDRLPESVQRAARLIGAGGALLLPAGGGGRPLGSIELLRATRRFEPGEIAGAQLVAAQVGLVLRAFGAGNGAGSSSITPEATLSLAGDALAAGLDQARSAEEVVWVAARASGAEAALLWSPDEDGAFELIAAAGSEEARAAAPSQAGLLPQEREPVRLEALTGEQRRTVATLGLGQPPLGVLQLVFASGVTPSQRELERLGTFSVRAAQALRAGSRARETSLELEHAQALLAVIGQAIAELSLAHTVKTAITRISELLGADRVAVYLRDGSRLRAATGRELSSAELTVAERLLELAFGPLRAQGMLHVADAQADARLAPAQEAVAEAGIGAALAVPLVAREELVGLLAAYLPRGRELSPNESSLLTALASQLAVAAQNARLHERTERLATEREEALAAEREAAKRLRALYEISRSFAQSLSLDATLDAVTTAAVELLEADAAVIRMEDERGDQLVPRSTSVADPRLEGPLRPLLTQDQSVERLPGRRLFRMGKPLVLDSRSAKRLGSSYELLVPFLEQGSTAVVVPIATPAELLATLTVVSLDPARRIGEDAIETALFVAGQAALAIDNARLYQQQKDFADTMQRSLLPRGLPEIEGLEVGAVYESSARVEVGGDVYDFLTLPDGKLAVVLGDASGHGVAATADMALAKFVFRSLVRLYPDPSELLTQANEVALGELAGGAFVTMVCVTVDPVTGVVCAASAGHQPMRALNPDGAVTALAPSGLALGIEADQHYEQDITSLPPGAALCLYTDGLIEVRVDGVQYGIERLDAALVTGRELSAQKLAEHVVADARRFAGEPEDDYAVVVIRRA